MLRIQRAQVDALRDSALRRFEQSTLRFVEQCLPKPYSLIGDEGALRVIRLGLERADRHGFSSERSVRIYITFMFLLGSYFDGDPLLPWAAEILRGDDSDIDRSAMLHERGFEYLQAVAGPDHGLFEAALARGCSIAPADLSSAADGMQDEIAAMLRWLYPDKVEHLGDGAVRDWIPIGIEDAGKHGVTSPRGCSIYLGFMFLLGSGFATDPHFPWASETLNDEALSSGDEKMQALHCRGAERFGRWGSGGAATR